MSKLKNPIGRSTDEWIGKTADTWPPPPTVQLRVLMRQDGRCAITDHKFSPGDAKQLDHTIPLRDGGENRESNLQWILDALAHKPKTAAENSARAPIIQRAKTHAGIRASKAKIASPPRAPRSTDKLDSIRALGPPMAFRSIGDIAGDVLAKINPKKAAE